MTEPDPHQPPPLPLGYSANVPGAGKSAVGFNVAKFFAGLIVGTALSAIVWITGWHRLVDQGGGAALVVVPGVKVVAGVVCVCLPRWRSFGIGLILSIALGALVFFGVCAANFNMR